MNLTLRLYHLARADFLERVRRHGFLVALLFCMYAGYGFLPPNPSRYATLKMDGYRGVYNSAWVGTAVAMLSAAFLSLIGFYLVKNAVERDRRTRVGEILATTPVSRVQYMLGKTFSNFAVLAAMTLIVAAACTGMQYLRAEDRSIDLYRIFSPFVLITLPPLFATAAIAVFFESLPVLRGGAGNIAWVFVWAFLLVGVSDRNQAVVHNDPLGNGLALPSMFEACRTAYPDFDPQHAGVSMGININDDMTTLKTFTWNGIDWTPKHIAWRFSWVLLGLAIGAVAAIPFDRFDPARARGRVGQRIVISTGSAADQTATPARVLSANSPRRARHSRLRTRWLTLAGARWRPPARGARVPGSAAPDASSVVHLTPLPDSARRLRLGAMIFAEWKLIVRGLRWWYAGPIAVTIASFTAPLSAVRSIVLPLAWFWPVLLWSKLGTRESRHNTEPVFFSSPHPLSRQLVATWIAGVMLAVFCAWAVAVRLLAAGELGALAAWVVGAAFAPALALALGVWTRSGKFFEALYTGFVYLILQSATPLDFMGASPAATGHGQPVVYAALTVLLLLFALLGRQLRLRG